MPEVKLGPIYDTLASSDNNKKTEVYIAGTETCSSMTSSLKSLAPKETTPWTQGAAAAAAAASAAETVLLLEPCMGINFNVPSLILQTTQTIPLDPFCHLGL